MPKNRGSNLKIESTVLSIFEFVSLANFQIFKLINLNRNDFISLLESEKLSPDNAALLNGLLKEFPYFQTAHLLYLKNLHDQNSIHYNNQLKVAAAYSADRKVLYELINKEDKNISVYSVPVTDTTQVVEVKPKEEIKIEPVKVVVPVELKTEEKIVVAPLITAPIIPTENSLVNAVKTEVPIKEESKPVDVDAHTISVYEKEILSKAIDSKITMEVEEEVKQDKPLQEIINYIKPVQNIIVEEKKSEPKLDKASSHSFSEWLKIAKAQNTEGIKDEQEQKKKNEYASLIDKFIKEEPKIAKANTTFFSPADKAKESVTETYGIVTETLARIYFKQGNLKKALRTYEILCLKHPEKKNIFAAQIDKIQNLINQNK